MRVGADDDAAFLLVSVRRTAVDTPVGRADKTLMRGTAKVLDLVGQINWTTPSRVSFSARATTSRPNTAAPIISSEERGGLAMTASMFRAVRNDQGHENLA
jgi:hypothetical protein